MEKIEWQVEGMDCTNCAISITKFLQKQNVRDIKVNFIGGDVHFTINNNQSKINIAKGITDLGYKIIDNTLIVNKTQVKNWSINSYFFSNHLQRFIFCLPFTLVLMMHMLPWHFHFLMNSWIQLAICLPVFIVGMSYFGVSAIKSLQRGLPNMNVLIAIGATAAFVYSLIGSLNNWGINYVFYETTATIITLVFLGEWIEHKSVSTTQKALNNLANNQKIMANMIAFDEEHKEQIFNVENNQLRIGDLILLKTGEQVPTDCKILWGDIYVTESLLTGESTPLHKYKKDTLIGGSLITDGIAKAQVTAVGKDTVLSNILNLVKQAQGEKPPIQQLADKISAIFVPAVLGIALLTFFINYFVFNISITASLMRSIAVLVISCPCAMGLATPAAIAVGLGRATKNGILFRNAKSLELFKDIKTVVFDKTGTLTNGNFELSNYACNINEVEFKQIIYSLEKFSNHPIAKSICNSWKTNYPIQWKKIEEIKGVGINAYDVEGNCYKLGKLIEPNEIVTNQSHTAYLYKNDTEIGWFNMEDSIREESKLVIDYLHSKNINTILLSGDSELKCQAIATKLGITKVYAAQSPMQKLKIIETLNNTEPVAMVGDGINDAPALAKATIGISLSQASQLAKQTAQVVLMNNGIKYLPMALGLGKHTFITIKQNLFWAFIYNIIALPIAACGFLHPGFAALAMGLSDVVLAINSIKLNYKKVL